MKVTLFLLVVLVLASAVNADIAGRVVAVTVGDTIKVLDDPTPSIGFA